MTTATAVLGERGLVRLPAAIREDAALIRGQELIMIVEGLGRVTLTTQEAIQAEVWAAAPEPSEVDPVDEVRSYRAADRATSDERHSRTVPVGDAGEPNPVGDALLQALGLATDV